LLILSDQISISTN